MEAVAKRNTAVAYRRNWFESTRTALKKFKRTWTHWEWKI
jgi:hypothetical protein